MHCFPKQQNGISTLLTAKSNSSSSPTNSATSDESSINASHHHSHPKPSDHYNNVKYEDIICHPIKPTYDGSLGTLIAFLCCLDIHRQDEDWSSIPFISQDSIDYDLIFHFAKINETTMIMQAQFRWHSPTLSQDKYTFGHPTYKVQCLALLLFSFIMDDLSITFLGCIEQDYHNDGPLLLWIICNNIHRNSIAFIETMKSKIRAANLQ